MNRDKLFLVIVIILALLVAGVVLFYSNKQQELAGPTEKGEKTILKGESDLPSLELTDEEKEALKEQGLEMPTGDDSTTKNLRTVKNSDEVEDISDDLNQTDLSSLDAELNEISAILSGL